MSDELITRAKRAYGALDANTYGGSAESAALQRIGRENTFIRDARTLLPELVAEVERLRAGVPWMEHVEYQRAMKRERDGECICDTGPETGGPEEDCPWHGREYSYWVERSIDLDGQRDQLRAEVENLRADHERAVQDWADNDACVLADSQRLAAEVETLRAAIETIRNAAKSGDWLDILAVIERTEQP